MEAFYQALSQHNDPARALVVAQRHLIASPDPLLAQPAIWASFGYTGIGVATGETVPTA
jgi:CHAT domain-containing protein